MNNDGVRLEELESGIAVRVTNEYVLIVNQDRNFVGQPENVLQTGGKNRGVVHRGVLALKSDFVSGSEKPSLDLCNVE